MITLSLLHPLHKTPVQSWTFDQEPVIRIGRSADNNVVLYSAVVSRHHVEIHRTENGWEIQSLGTNGTYLDGHRITQTPVANGIIIRLARSGPNIQIHTTEEKRDALKDLLSSRRNYQDSPPLDTSTHMEALADAGHTPTDPLTRTTVVNTD